MPPQIAVLQRQALPLLSGQQCCRPAQFGGDAVAAGIFHACAQREGLRHPPVSHQGTSAHPVGGIVVVVKAVAHHPYGRTPVYALMRTPVYALTRTTLYVLHLTLHAGTPEYAHHRQQQSCAYLFSYHYHFVNILSAISCILEARSRLLSSKFQIPSSLSTPRFKSCGSSPFSSSAKSRRHSSLSR